jgi:NTP pyrophosphatase (non-canonical NTP hydrolase)
MSNAPPYSIGSDHWPGLSKLAEEAGEVTQVIGKLLGNGGKLEHWDGTNLKERLEEEIADLEAACFFVRVHCNLDEEKISLRVINKIELFKKWHAEQK